MQQRLSIARALLHNPQILLFDEPYTGLDQQAGTTLDELFNEAMSGGRTIVMATHQLERAVNLAERVIIISKGKVGYDSPTAGLTSAQLTTDYADITGTVTSR
jgi:heme exporter protein A